MQAVQVPNGCFGFKGSGNVPCQSDICVQAVTTARVSSTEYSLRCLVATVAFGMVSSIFPTVNFRHLGCLFLYVNLVTGDGCFRCPVYLVPNTIIQLYQVGWP